MSNGYLLDENLSIKLIPKLEPFLGYISHVSLAGLTHKADKDVWEHAKEKNLVLITKDNDFFYMSHLFGCPPKVIKLNCGNQSTTFIADIIAKRVETIAPFSTGDSCYLEIL